MATVDNLVNEMTEVLRMYHADVLDSVRKETQSVVKDMVKETKSTAPRESGMFAKHIACKKLVSDYRTEIWVWYVKAPSYRLAHLLNNGHDIVLNKKVVGRARGTGFITNAANTAITRYENRLKEILENGK